MKIRKRILSMLTALAMLMSLVPSFTLTAGAEDITTISGVTDLVAFRDSVNGGNTYDGKTVTLTADIDLSGVCGADIGGSEVSWTPIGDSSNQFKGTFDGGNNKITGLYINAPSNDYQGLFGYIGEDSTVKNLGVDGTVLGKGKVGGIVGYNGTVQNCCNTGTVTGTGDSVGGIVGYNGTVQNCYNTGTISSTGNNVGGLVGWNTGNAVQNCYNTGAVSGGSNVGGVVGYTWNDVTKCYSVGTVTGTGSNVGGVVGYKNGGNPLTSCYYDSTVNTTSNATIGVKGMPTADFAEQTNFSDWDFGSVWKMSASLGRPILKAISEPEPHSHDMSVECGQTDAVDFDHALTSENGKLCIDGAVLEPDAGNNLIYLPEGNYYLAENVTLANIIEIRGGINLCLNGHTLDMGENRIIIMETGNLKLCDCGEGGQITGAYNGNSNIAALIETSGEFSMYGGSVMNTSADGLKNKKAVSAWGGTVRLYGGEVVSHNDSAVMVAPNTGASLHLSGEPVIQSLTYDKGDIYLDNDYSARIITLDAPLTITSPYRVAADGENVFTSGWSEQMGTAAFSDYFISATKGRFIAKDENELKIYDYAITQQPSAANSYTITANGAPDYAPTSYKWYLAEVVTKDITDQNAFNYEYNGSTSSYDSITGLWTGVNGMDDLESYYFTILNLSKGDVVKIKPSDILDNYTYAYLENDDNRLYTKTTNENGEYEFTVPADGQYTFYFNSGNTPTVKATIIKTNKKGEVKGQTTNQLTAKYAGSYLCEVRYEDGTVLTSNVFDYTPSAPPAEHKHDMSVSCGHDSEIVFDKVLTSDEDGNLYINDAIVPDSPDFCLDDGNYYLADNLSLNSGIEIIGDVNLCLNGKTLEFKDDYHYIDVNGDGIREIDFNICDCGTGGKITGTYSIDVDYLGLVSNSDTMSLYGGTIENSSTDTTDGNYQRAITNAGMLNLYGGEIVSQNDDALASAYNAMKINLAGNTKITGADSAADIFLYKSEDQSHAGDAYLALLLISDAFANVEPAKPYRIAADSADVVAFFTRGWSDKMSDKEIGKYFTSVMKGHGIRKNTDGELEFYALQITEQPSEDNNYTVTAKGNPTGYQWYSSETDEAVSGQTSNRFTGNADGKYYCIVTYLDGATVKSEEIDYKYTTAPPAEHKHDMSAECEHDNDVTFDSAITYADGKLYVNGTEIAAQSDGFGNNSYSLGDGNFYLASDAEFSEGKNYLKFNGSAKLCLNGHTTNATINIGQKNDVGGVLDMCDCDEKKLGTIDAANNSGDIMNNKDGVQIENASSESVKNTFNMYGGNIFRAYRGVVALAEGNFNMYGGKVTGGSTALFTWCPTHLYGGEISGNETGIMVCSPVYLHSGAVIKNNTVDLEWYASSENKVTIDGYAPADGYKLTVGKENMREPFDITTAANADYSGYFEESADIKTGSLWKIKNSGEGANQVVQLTDAENLSITKDGVTSYYATLERAFEAAADGDTIKAEKDYADIASASLEDGKEITLDLNGKHISAQGSDPVMLGTDEGKLTIKGNGTFDGIIVHTGGELVIENGTYGYLFISYPDGITLNGGTFKGGKYSESNSSSGIVLQITGYNEDASKAKLEAALGTDRKFSKEIKTSTVSIEGDTLSAAYFDGEVKVIDLNPSPSASPSTSPAVTDTPSASPSTSPAVTDTPSSSPSTSPAVTDTPSASPTAKPKRRGGSSSKSTPAPKPTATPTVTPTAEPDSSPKPTGNPSGTEKQHKAYIVGYEGYFYPDGNITRAETAAILARLADDFDENRSYSTKFSDVADNLWYYKYISFMESKNVIKGYLNGEFKPENSITRAEFASMIANYADLSDTDTPAAFEDIIGHWAEEAIKACQNTGYIKGYDNKFRPDEFIARSEAVSIINRVLGRNDIKDFTNPFRDVTENHWAYIDIMEASVEHSVK